MMNATVMRCFNSMRLGEPQSHRNLFLFPLVGEEDGGALYLTLEEAIQSGALRVTEVSQSGSVPELKVVCRSPKPVLLLDGEQLVGAKQNRVLNTSILLREESDTVIPVSCTEQGRWSQVSAAFSTSDAVMSRRGRARKSRSVTESLASDGRFRSDQGEVWSEVAALHASTGTSSSTGAMQDAFAGRASDLAACLEAFTICAGQTGLLVVVDGEVAGLDGLGHPEVYRRLHPKLVRSYAIDALTASEPKVVSPETARAAACEFLKEAVGCAEQSFPSIGYGTDWRYTGAGVAGAALAHDDRVVHVAFFRLPPRERGSVGMSSWHQRRRRYQ